MSDCTTSVSCMITPSLQAGARLGLCVLEHFLQLLHHSSLKHANDGPSISLFIRLCPYCSLPTWACDSHSCSVNATQYWFTSSISGMCTMEKLLSSVRCGSRLLCSFWGQRLKVCALHRQNVQSLHVLCESHDRMFTWIYKKHFAVRAQRCSR